MIVALTRFLSRGCKSLARTVCAGGTTTLLFIAFCPKPAVACLGGPPCLWKDIATRVTQKGAGKQQSLRITHRGGKQSEQTARVTKKTYTNTGLLRPIVTQERSHKNTTSHKTSGIRSKTTLIKTNKNTYFITIKTGYWSHLQNTSNNFFPFSGRAILTYRQQDASLKRANNFFVNQQETRKKLLHNTFTKIGTNHTPTRPLVPSSPQPLVT